MGNNLTGGKIAGVLGIIFLLFCAFLVAVRVMPIPLGTDAITLCFPISGPVMRFRSGLEPDQREIVEAHEGVHAAQCERMGSLKYLSGTRDVPARLGFEAEAFCAEMRVYIGKGADPELLTQEVVAELYKGYRNERNMSKTELRALLRSHCQDMVPEEP